MLAQLKLDESAKLEFNVAITGTTDQPKYRFVIESDDSMSFVFDCKHIGEQLQVTIPAMKDVIDAGDKHAYLEVIVDGKYFIPLKDVINFEPVIEVVSNIAPVLKSADTIKVSNVVVKKSLPTDSDGYITLKKKTVM